MFKKQYMILSAKGATGPLVQRLEELLCLVVGAFGEVLEDFERTLRPLLRSELSSSPGRLAGLCLTLRLVGSWDSTGGCYPVCLLGARLPVCCQDGSPGGGGQGVYS